MTLRKKLALGLMASLSLGAITLAGTAREARADTPVPTGATVVTGSMAPTISCKWELPDVNDNAGDGVQYGQDDNAALTPGVPCQLTAGTVGMADNVAHMIQVLPNAENLPTEKMVELWAAVGHPAGISNISDVYWDIFHPDGTAKIQVHGVRDLSCTGPAGMFAAAQVTGQLSNAAINDTNNGIVALCQQGGLAIYHATFLISKHQPSGEYKVAMTAVSSGATSHLTNYLDVIPFYNLVTDFTNVDFGVVTAGLDKSVLGDLDMTTPGRPTVKNTGNSGMGIAVLFTDMVNSPDPVLAKHITQFDAKFGRTPATLQDIPFILSGAPAAFDDNAERVLCPNRVGKLDLSVHPPSTLPAGVYTGQVTVIARRVAICLTDNGSVSPLPGAGSDPAGASS